MAYDESLFSYVEKTIEKRSFRWSHHGVKRSVRRYRIQGLVFLWVTRQVASIVHTHHAQILVDLPEVQQQLGSSDCGLFAIAFATSILKGEDPSSVRYIQSRMRQHVE